MKKLEQLKQLSIETTPPNNLYWLKEEAVLKQRAKQNEEIANAIKMTFAKFNQPFDI